MLVKCIMPALTRIFSLLSTMNVLAIFVGILRFECGMVAVAADLVSNVALACRPCGG